MEFQAALLVVARRPSRTPDWAAMPEPVQIVIRYWSLGKTERMKAISGPRSGDRAPGPPGMMRTWRLDGGEVRVWVGEMVGQKVDLWVFIIAEAGSEVTGRRVRERRVRVRWRLC